jgi:deoxyadenosine/deoxycytidine kinase
MSKVINLFGGPGVGKSSIAAGLIHKLKKKHISCDAPYEFPKVLAWDNNKEAIKDQLYVLANQHRGIAKSYGKVDYIVVDSPIILSMVYKDYYNNPQKSPSCLYLEEFDNLILKMHNYYDNVNIVLVRSKDGEHNEKERYHNLNESIELDTTIVGTLNKYNINFIEVPVDENTIDVILKHII